MSSLPSPYYHFEYDTNGRLILASYASGLTKYTVSYDAGRVASIKYIDASGQVFTVVFFSYDGSQLVKLERNQRVAGSFILDTQMSFSYDPDGNVREIAEHRPAIDRQAETTTVDRYERYDAKLNVEDFDLLHTEFFDHLLLLPGTHLQKGNPGRVTRTGDGVNFTVEYTYTYNAGGRPLTKRGDFAVQNGPDAGKVFQTLAQYSYY